MAGPKHVMISYNWNALHVVNDIESCLADSFVTWRDTRNMPSNIQEGMAGGVTDAEVVIVVLTNMYANSANCITEVDLIQAKKKKKVIMRDTTYVDDNLKITALMGTERYVSFTQYENGAVLFDRDALLGLVALQVPESSKARRVKQRILLVGPSKVGKSTIASMLINRRVKEGQNDNDINTSSLTGPGTFDVNTYSNASYDVIDTVGFVSEGEMDPFPNAEAIEKLFHFLLSSGQGYNIIAFVADSDRPSAATSAIFDLFYRILFEDLRNNFVLIATGADAASVTDEQKKFTMSHYDNIPMIMVDFVVLPTAPPTPELLELWKQVDIDNLKEIEGVEHQLAVYKRQRKVPKNAFSLKDSWWRALLRRVLEFFGKKLTEEKFTALYQRVGQRVKQLQEGN